MPRISAALSRFLAVFFALVSLSVAAGAQTSPGDPSDPYDKPYDCHHDCGGAEGETAPGRVLTTTGGRYEFIVIGAQGEAAQARAIIERNGGAVHRTSELSALRQTSQIATFPSMSARDRARAEIEESLRSSSLAQHNIYGFAQSARGPRLYAPGLIGDAAPGNCRLSRRVRIGMVDGPVNTDHPALPSARVHYETVTTSHRAPGANHGTAVAALIVGEDSTGVLSGFAQGAELFAVSAFDQTDAGEEASVEHIAQAIDRLIGHRVEIINLSISGPENTALARAISAAASRGVVMIGASGNDQRPSVAWPAAAPEVIAVTAVDAARRRFRRANTGTQVEFAAPGVDVYTARARGAGYVTGTSFAAPIVTALVARHMTHGARSLSAIRARLRGTVAPLGGAQRTAETGWGLVQSSGC